MQENVWFCQNRTEKLVLPKSGILKIRQVFSSKFDDGNRHFWSFFGSKLRPPRKGPSRTLAKCFVLYHLGDLIRPPPFFHHFLHFSCFLSVSPFFSSDHDFASGLCKTYNFWKRVPQVPFLLLSSLWQNCHYYIRKTYNSSIFSTFFIICLFSGMMSFTKARITILKKKSQNGHQTNTQIPILLLR